MDNREFLLNIGFEFDTDDFYNNERINDFFDVYNLVPFKVTFKNKYNKEQEVEILPSNCEMAFQDKIWSRLNLAQRLRVLKWEQTLFLNKCGRCGIVPSFEYVGYKELDQIVYNAASTNHSLILNLKNISIGNGYEALKSVIHESIHQLDYDKLYHLLNKYRDYLPANRTDMDILNSLIMQLSVKGLNYNFRTGRNTLVTPKMGEEILLLKNLVVRLNKEKRIGADNNDNLLSKLNEAFYCNSPLERNAFIGSGIYVDKIMAKNIEEYGLDASDVLQLGQKDKTTDTINAGKKLIKKVYGTASLSTAMNMELVYAYNKSKFKGKTERYICKSLMEKRMKKLDEFKQKNADCGMQKI